MFTSIIAAAAAVASLGSMASAPSSIHVEDGADDVAHGVDLQSVDLENTSTFVKVKLHHADLVTSFESGAGGRVYLDTDRKDKGPELVFLGGFYEGTGYDLLETEGFSPSSFGAVVDRGTWRMTLDYDQEKTVMRMSRKAVGADDVRVAVRVNGDAEEGVVTDWLGEPRSFTEWTARADD